MDYIYVFLVKDCFVSNFFGGKNIDLNVYVLFKVCLI